MSTTTLDRTAVVEELDRYVRQQFLDGDQDEALTPDSPLLEWGVLNSMNTALLMAHVHETYGVVIPPTAITAKHFRDLNSVADLVLDLRSAAG